MTLISGVVAVRNSRQKYLQTTQRRIHITIPNITGKISHHRGSFPRFAGDIIR